MVVTDVLLDFDAAMLVFPRRDSRLRDIRLPWAYDDGRKPDPVTAQLDDVCHTVIRCAMDDGANRELVTLHCLPMDHLTSIGYLRRRVSIC